MTLVVTDLDGTLWDSSLRASDRSLSAIATVLERSDTELLVATGRRRNSARLALHHNGLSLPSVLLNGAVGWDFRTEESFRMVCFDPSVLRAALDVLLRHDVVPVTYLADTSAVALPGVSTCPDHLATIEADLVWMEPGELAGRSDALGMCVLGVAPEIVASAVSELEERLDVSCSSFADRLYPPHSLMVAPSAVDKADGVAAWIEHAQLDVARIIALGDAGNDLGMLEMADVALVVEHAEPSVRAVADRFIAGPADGGWADVLDLL